MLMFWMQKQNYYEVVQYVKQMRKDTSILGMCFNDSCSYAVICVPGSKILSINKTYQLHPYATILKLCQNVVSLFSGIVFFLTVFIYGSVGRRLSGLIGKRLANPARFVRNSQFSFLPYLYFSSKLLETFPLPFKRLLTFQKKSGMFCLSDATPFQLLNHEVFQN